MYDNDCKYCLFKGNLIKAEDKKETPDPEQDDAEKTDDDMEKADNDAEKTDDSAEKTEDNTSSHPVDNTPSSSPHIIPPINHRLYGVYWLNDSSVGLVVSDRFDAAKTRVLAVNIHGGVDTISLPFPPASCVFQQVRTITLSFPVGSGRIARDHAT